jgi:transcriptional regulator with XRE-family HTH domain
LGQFSAILLKNRLHSNLGNALKAARKSKELKQSDLASMCALSLPTIIKAEKGQGLLSTYKTVIDNLGYEVAGRTLPSAESLGESLALLRNRQKISLRTLSEMSDVSVPTILAIESNISGHLAPIEQIATVLGAGLFLHPVGTPLPFYKTAAISSNYQAWSTPPEILDKLYPMVDGEFDLDPCSTTRDKNLATVKAKIHYTGEDGCNGLSLPWFGNVFINPPYGKSLKKWIKKAHDEAMMGNTKLCIAMIPARPDTNAWHNWIVNKADIFMLKGRIRFAAEGKNDVAPFPSAIVIWNADTRTIHLMQSAFSTAWHIPLATKL